MNHTIDILACTCDECGVQAARCHVSRAAAREAYHALYRRGEVHASWITRPNMPVVRHEPDGATTKFTQRVDHNLETESVLIPATGSAGRRRVTLCVSSQIGCALGCAFCETAQMGWLRNLSTAEIVAQWFAARHELNQPVDNIVFMGMGEPMENLDAVIGAIRVLSDHHGPAIAPSRITVSTVGRAQGIQRLAKLRTTGTLGPIRLAVSINAPNDDIRSRIMPINRAEPMTQLMNAMRCWPDRILIEYVLIPGVNDAPEHATQLCTYLQPIDCTVNVIPYNPRRESPWPAPEEDRVNQFIEALAAGGQFVKRRHTQGRSIMAGCGQLGSPAVRRRRPQPVRLGSIGKS